MQGRGPESQAQGSFSPRLLKAARETSAKQEMTIDEVQSGDHILALSTYADTDPVDCTALPGASLAQTGVGIGRN